MCSIGCRQSRCAISTDAFVLLLLVATAVAQFRHLLFFAAPLPRSSPPLSSFNRCFPGAISAATCCAIPTHGFLAPLSRHIHCVVATHLSTSSPLGRHIRCAISTSVILKKHIENPPGWITHRNRCLSHSTGVSQHTPALGSHIDNHRETGCCFRLDRTSATSATRPQGA